MNQSSMCWASTANLQPGLWVEPKANQPSLVHGAGGVGTDGEPELRSSGKGGGEKSGLGIRSLRSFAFFLKERSVLSVLFRSL